jgi:1-acyl-sn-glycerol-3-phosphate acyltransferase
LWQPKFVPPSIALMPTCGSAQPSSIADCLLLGAAPTTATVLWVVVGLCAWALLVCIAWQVRRVPRPSDDDTFGGVVSVLLRAYCRLFHGVRVEGEVPEPRSAEQPGLLVVCNHTAGIDPMLVQTALPFYVRWMMASDMIHPQLAFIYEWLRVIEVDRTGNDRSSVREAVRALKAGEVVGIFPEGRIGREPGKVLPFLPGAGLITHLSSCDVLPVAIVGTPSQASAFGSLIRPSKSRVRVLPVMRGKSLPKNTEGVKEIERVIGEALAQMMKS